MTSSAQRQVRFDDLVANRSFGLVNQTDEGWAHNRAEVVAALDAAGRAARAGSWTAIAVAYEAAGAFDAALETAEPRGPLLWWGGFANRTPLAPPTAPGGLPLSGLDASALDAFADTVRTVQEEIRRGDYYQANLSVPLLATLAAPPQDVYAAIASAQRAAFSAYLDLGTVQLASASPELFFEAREGRLRARPMKGTRPPSRADELRLDAKERAENIMIVDLLRNDLARVALPGSVHVTSLMDIEVFPSVAQATSTIEARIAPATDLVELFAALFPCGSVTGAPKVTAMRAIAELEAEQRGFYCGAIGVLAPGRRLSARFSVPIRTAVLQGDRAEYRVGSGITLPSDPLAETAELALKGRVFTRLASS